MGRAQDVGNHTFPKDSSQALLHHKRNAQVFPPMSHSIEKGNKTHLMGRAQKVGTHTFPKVYPYFSQSIAVSIPSDSYPLVYFITQKMHVAHHQYPLTWENAAKYIIGGEPGTLVPILFPKYGWFSSIRFPFCEMFHCMKIQTFQINFSWHGKMQQSPSHGRELEHRYPYFLPKYGYSFPWNFHPMVFYVT